MRRSKLGHTSLPLYRQVFFSSSCNLVELFFIWIILLLNAKSSKRGPILFWWRLLSISRVARNHSWWIGPSDGGIFLFFREGQCKNDVVRLFLKGRKTTTAAQKKAKHFVGFCGVAALGCGDPCIIIAIRQEPPGKLNTGITWRNRLERRDCGQCCCWSMGIVFFCLISRTIATGGKPLEMKSQGECGSSMFFYFFAAEKSMMTSSDLHSDPPHSNRRVSRLPWSYFSPRVSLPAPVTNFGFFGTRNFPTSWFSTLVDTSPNRWWCWQLGKFHTTNETIKKKIPVTSTHEMSTESSSILKFFLVHFCLILSLVLSA